MNDVIVPDGYLRFSDAVSRLAEGMWGGLPRPIAVQTFKRTSKKASLGFGPWQEQAGQRLTRAVVKGELAVYVIADPQVLSKKPAPTRRAAKHMEPVVGVPVNVLNRLITTSRGSPIQRRLTCGHRR